jgi:Fur family ferric uptake transcriptional regulator
MPLYLDSTVVKLEVGPREPDRGFDRIEKACMERPFATEQRRVIPASWPTYDHPDAEELYRRAIAVDLISIATVYRTVKLFEDAEI